MIANRRVNEIDLKKALILRVCFARCRYKGSAEFKEGGLGRVALFRNYIRHDRLDLVRSSAFEFVEIRKAKRFAIF